MPDSQLTNAQLAQKISDLIDLWRTRELQMVAWISGPAGGGDHSDGAYPLSDYLGNVTYQPSPAQLASEVVGPVANATAQATAAAGSSSSAAASATAAALSATAAAGSSTKAVTNATNAASAAGDANTYRNAASAFSTAAANSSAAALASQTAAHTSELNSASSAGAASGSATAAAGSASAAAASAATAAKFNPALYATLAGTNVFTSQLSLANAIGLTSKNTSGALRNLITLFSDNNVYVDATDATLFLRSASGVSINAPSNGTGAPLTANTNNTVYAAVDGSNSTLILKNSNPSGQSPLDFFINGTLRGRVRADYVGNLNLIANGGGFEFFTGGDAGVGSIALEATSTGVRIGGASLYIGAGNRRAIWDAADNYLRLNGDNSYSNGVYTPGFLRATGTIAGDGLITAGSDVYATGGFRYASDTSFYFYNTSGFSYGSWRVGGARNGYIGVVLDDGIRATFMSNGTSFGVYSQNAGYWAWLETGASFRTTHPVQDSNGAAYLRHTQYGSAAITVQSGGSPSGGTSGDIFFIY